MDDIEKVEEMYNVFSEVNGDPLAGISLLTQEFKFINISNVYHYTDISGFISIMENKELWASHISFMNDKSEYQHGKLLFQKKLNERITVVSEEEKKLLKEVGQSLDNEESAGFFATSSKDVFSLSFSRNSDSLEMWRGYGKTSGIAIGIDTVKCNGNLPGACLIRKEMYDKLLDEYGGQVEQVCPNYEQLLVLYNVFYEKDKKEKLVESIIDMGLKHFKRRNEMRDSTALISAIQYLSDMIFYMTPFFKHEGFKGEEESRFVENFVRRNGANDGLKIYYRGRCGVVLPYIKYKIVDRNCRPIKEMPISEIVVGPSAKQDKVIESIKYFLERNNMIDIVEKVRPSDIPYVADR